MWRLMLLFMVIVLLPLRNIAAQQEPTAIAPGVFLRGLQLPQGVRYTATFIKPTDNMPMRNISVEITLPPDTAFYEMLVSRQVEYKVIRVNQAGALTLIWQISRVDGAVPLDAFAFTTAEPLTSEAEFYLKWEDEAGNPFIENFLEVPPVAVATQPEGQITLPDLGYQAVGDTGVYLASSAAPVDLSVRVLPGDFNPPAEYGDIWWCSLLELNGLPAGSSAEIVVPLRRPVAPFTTLQLFRQQADGSWLPLVGQALVSADGQFAMYTHPGGLVATGGDKSIQLETVPVTEIEVIQETPAPPPAEENQNTVEVIEPPAESTDGSGNTVVVEESPAPPPAENAQEAVEVAVIPTEPPPGTITDGSGNSQNNPTAAPPVVEGITIAPVQPTSAVVSGNGSVVVGGKPTSALLPGTPALQPTIGEQRPTSTPIPPSTSTPAILPTLGGQSTLPSITDGSSNTFFVGERTPTLSNFTDGTSNTLPVGGQRPTRTPTLPGTPAIFPTLGGQNPVATFSDGSSNTVFVGERTPTLSSFTDGTSNTLPVGGQRPTSTPTPQGTPGILPTLGGQNPVATFSDGSSNTIGVGELRPTRTPTPPGTPGILPTIGGQSTLPGITDGSSNTVLIGERTSTPALLPTLPGENAQILPGITNGAAGSPTPGVQSGSIIVFTGSTDASGSFFLVGGKPTGSTTPGAVTTPTPTLPPTIAPLPTATRPAGTITDGSSNTVFLGEIPTSTTAPRPTATLPAVATPTRPPASPPPPTPTPIIRVAIIVQTNGTVAQCQGNGTICTTLTRRKR